MGRGRMPLRSPKSPTIQHPPQTGRKKQAQDVSQLCSLTDF